MTKPDEAGLTPDAAQGYESFFVPAIFAQWPQTLIQAAQVQRGDHILDAGCGTGILTRDLCPLVGPSGKVTGLDLSESMLCVARNICSEATFQQGNVMKLPYSDSQFDCVFAPFMMMFVPDISTAIAELWRVLKPQGRLIISVWDALEKNDAYSTLVALARTHLDEEAARSLAMPFQLGTDGLLIQQIRTAGITNATTSHHDGRAQFASIAEFITTEIKSWVLAEKVNDSRLASLIADAEQAFSEFCAHNQRLDIPLNAVIAVARK